MLKFKQIPTKWYKNQEDRARNNEVMTILKSSNYTVLIAIFEKRQYLWAPAVDTKNDIDT